MASVMTAAERRSGRRGEDVESKLDPLISISHMLDGGERVPVRIGVRVESRIVTVVDV
jgi:hypothetical protein